MRRYRYEATGETIETLRLLRSAWAGIRAEPGHVTIRLADAREVRLAVEGADQEPDFEAFRLSAAIDSDTPPQASQRRREGPPFREAADFAVGRNDVVLFTGATWLEGYDAGNSATRPPSRRNPILQCSGHPGQISESAVAVCHTTDAVVIASPVGTGFLIRTALRPYSLEVTDDPVALDRFLRERGYRS